MKIGILSMQKILNYGSFLQALSLKIQFEQRGHDVYFIDIEQGRQIVKMNLEKFQLTSKFDKYLFKRIENYSLSKRMDKIHMYDYIHYLETGKQLLNGVQFDLVVIGSDEVFNATAPSRWGFSSQLFGDVNNTKCIVTYAASCGYTTFEVAEKYGIIQEIQKAMQNLSAISVRDQNTFDFVCCINGTVPTIHVDPVFLTDFDVFIPKMKKRKPYLLVYAYGNRICDETEISTIKKYAKNHKLDIVCVGMQQRWCSHNIAASAFELLWYFKNANCIITDTFHGTVFSIKYGKKFVTLIRDSNRNKLGGLLKQFGLMNRSVDHPETLESIMEELIEFKNVQQIIIAEQEKSACYLNEICRRKGEMNA